MQLCNFIQDLALFGCGWYPDVLTSKRQRVEELPLKNEGLVLAKSKYTLGSIQKLKAYVICT